ncbi:MAG: hypothetical protein J5966_08980, partial [Lachnospiraceae bacterium]|nr:hypothetical protein [Lachnospiraceae bacterium]
MSNNLRWWKHLDFILLDVATVEIVYFLCVRFWLGRDQLLIPIYKSTFVVLLLLGLVDGIFGTAFYRDILKRHFLREALASVEYVTVIVGLLMLYQYMMQLGPQFSRGIFLFVWFFGSIAVLFVRQLYKRWLRRHLAARARRSSLLLVTDKAHADEEISRIAKEIEDQYTLTCVAIVDDVTSAEDRESHLPDGNDAVTILHNTDHIFDYMK